MNFVKLHLFIFCLRNSNLYVAYVCFVFCCVRIGFFSYLSRFDYFILFFTLFFVMQLHRFHLYVRFWIKPWRGMEGLKEKLLLLHCQNSSITGLLLITPYSLETADCIFSRETGIIFSSLKSNLPWASIRYIKVPTITSKLRCWVEGCNFIFVYTLSQVEVPLYGPNRGLDNVPFKGN